MFIVSTAASVIALTRTSARSSVPAFAMKSEGISTSVVAPSGTGAVTLPSVHVAAFVDKPIVCGSGFTSLREASRK